MKKIILSAVVAAMALTTTASALEDIKVKGQAKLWYETNDKGEGLFNKDKASGEVAFKLAITGKQGNVGFGATVYNMSTMGLENTLVTGARTYAANDDMYLGEAYITAPIGAKTLLKFGKQELDTPLAFTERWNAAPNTFNAAVAINNSIKNLTLIAAYVGQGSANDQTDNNNDGKADATWKTNGTPTQGYTNSYTDVNSNSTYAVAALYKTNALAVNFWAYELSSVANAIWIDAAMKVGPVALKGYAASMMPKADSADDTTAFALSAGMKVGKIKLFAAASMVGEDGSLRVANTATGFKKTKLPTAGVYTDGVYVADMDSTAFKLKAATKLGSTGIALQAVNNTNGTNAAKETTEIDLIITQKVGDFNFKAIALNRSFDDKATDTKSGGNHIRVIASVNF